MPSSSRSWIAVPCENPSAAPCHRSLHVCAVRKDSLYVFGGYDGSSRINDFYEFNFNRKLWSVVLAIGSAPSPRDRHVAVVYKDSLYVFAGFDGSSRVNDFVEYNFSTQRWSNVVVNAGLPPTARHSHAAVISLCTVLEDMMVATEMIFTSSTLQPDVCLDLGELDRNRFDEEFRLTAVSCCSPGIGHHWWYISTRAYYLAATMDLATLTMFTCMTSVRVSENLYVVHSLSLTYDIGRNLNGLAPIARDSHVAVIHSNSMYIFGGSTGTAVNDFYELNLGKWSIFVSAFDDITNLLRFLMLGLRFNGQPPGQRFCHVGTVYDSSLIIFGGYDGSSRLNDFKQFRFGEKKLQLDIPESTLISDLRLLVNNDIMSDVTFIVEGIPVYGHKILCIRCSYFNAMLTGEMLESRAREIQITDVRRPIFISLMEYLYTDYIDVAVDIAMELFVTADRYGVERLKRICESKMLGSLCVENAASIFHAADLHNATVLRDQCVTYMLHNFDAVTKTDAFEEMGRTNVELVFELLKRR
ncbi:hypothetical protein KXD40_004310 [Peronospora effusa]|nr:hypothetical protein KXD40_004310 [Peronospora effusa]